MLGVNSWDPEVLYKPVETYFSELELRLAHFRHWLGLVVELFVTGSVLDFLHPGLLGIDVQDGAVFVKAI